MLRTITLLALVVGLFMPTIASAQRRGGGSGGHGWNGNQSYGSQGSGAWHGDQRNYGYGYQGNGAWHGGQGNWYNGGNHGYYGVYLGLGSLGGYGYYGGYPYYPYSSYYGQGGYAWYPGTRYSSGYFDPNTYDASVYQNNNTTINANRARVEVILPDPSAELIIQGQTMDLIGRNRIFVSPQLIPGKTYTYTITMRRMIAGRSTDDTRKIEVQVGSNSTLDFNTVAVRQTPRPASAREDIALPLPK